MPLTLRRFTVDEYHRMGETGILHEDDRVELLDGQIVVMSPIGVPHASCVKRLNGLFAPLIGHRVTIGVQDPLVLSAYEEPQPDVAVLRHRADGYRIAHPGPADTLLVIEVADTSVEDDRSTKIPRYAAANIPEAWLVNLPADCIEVYRDPAGGAYRSITRVTRDHSLKPLRLPEIELRANEILG